MSYEPEKNLLEGLFFMLLAALTVPILFGFHVYELAAGMPVFFRESAAIGGVLFLALVEIGVFYYGWKAVNYVSAAHSLVVAYMQENVEIKEVDER